MHFCIPDKIRVQRIVFVSFQRVETNVMQMPSVLLVNVNARMAIMVMVPSAVSIKYNPFCLHQDSNLMH